MNKIMKKEDGTKNFLIDGFPRSIDQAQAFAKFVRVYQCGQCFTQSQYDMLKKADLDDVGNAWPYSYSLMP